MKQDKAFVGDFIITNENFRVKNDKGSLIVKDDFDGVIVKILEVDASDNAKELYLVRFANELEWTEDLDGLLRDPSGYMLLRDEFEIDNY